MLLNLPNRLTLTRIGLIPFFVLSLHVQALGGGATASVVGRWVALVLFIVAAITDYYDGAIARKRGLVTIFGQLFDPLADKLLTMSAFVLFVEIRLTDGRSLMPAWAVIIILGREFLVTGLRSVASASGKVIQADNWGKHKTAWQLGGIMALLLSLAISDTLSLNGGNISSPDNVLRSLRIVVLVSVLGLTILSGLAFLRRNWALIVPDQPEAATNRLKAPDSGSSQP